MRQTAVSAHAITISSAAQSPLEIFFERREAEKQRLYQRVVFLSLTLAFVAMVFVCIILVMWGLFGSGSLQNLFIFLNVLSWFVLSVGVCAASTVPVSDFDVDAILEANFTLRVLVEACLGTAGVGFGVLMCTLQPHAFGVPVLALALAILLHDVPAMRRLPLTTKISMLLSVSLLGCGDFFALQAWAPLSFPANALFPGLYAGYSQLLARYYGVVQPLMSLAGALFCLAGLGVAFFYLRFLPSALPPAWRLKQHSGWRTTVLFASIYAVMVGMGQAFLFLAVAGLLTPIFTLDLVIELLISMVFCLLPPLITLCVGQRQIFTLLARSFEYDLRRQQEDGTEMAHLASDSAVLDPSGVRWVLRRREALALKPAAEDANHIKRSLWVKGSVVEKVVSGEGAMVITLLVSMQEDCDPLWYAKYEGTNLVLGRWQAASSTSGGGTDAAAAMQPPAAALDTSFMDWVSATFEAPAAIDSAARTVSLRLTLTGSQSKEMLREWATDNDNFRAFEWEMRRRDLFLRSPRELASKEERDATFSLSRPRFINSNADKLDFFISHSWSDDGVAKYKKLKAFMEAQQLALGRYPSLWLDKFCNKELALERVVIMPLVEDSEGAATVKKFDLDAAHCFDPNEEFKLRSLIASIGVERLQQCIAFMDEKLSQPPSEEGGTQGGWWCRAAQAVVASQLAAAAPQPPREAAVASQLAAAAPLLPREANESAPVQAPVPAPSAALLPVPAAAEGAAAPRVGRIYEDAEWLSFN